MPLAGVCQVDNRVASKTGSYTFLKSRTIVASSRNLLPWLYGTQKPRLSAAFCV